MTTNEHEVIFAIVNAGFAEDAMAVARQQGVRGGTILNALYTDLPVSDVAGLVKLPEETTAE